VKLFEKSFAKINVFLDVLKKRDDGFHEISTLFTRIGLYDLISVEKSKSFNIFVNKKFIPNNEENIVYKTYEKLSLVINQLPNINVHIFKNIPIGAGLGGGSSNAATFLNLVDKLLTLNLSYETKHSILSKVGSDTCFFLHDKPMLGRGRGEVLERVGELPFLYILLVKPNIFISTKEIYENLNLPLTNRKEIFKMRPTLSFHDVLKVMNNDLEMPAFSIYKELAFIKEKLKINGALKAMLSGSGATVFGVFNSNFYLNHAYLYFKKNFPNYFVYKTTNI
jgi:4-diphosphocytidyl-2-C-methyl-D-erythritol kinase